MLILSVAVLPVSVAGGCMDDATPISLNTEYSDTITDLSPVDYFVLELPQSDSLTVQITMHIYKTNFALLDVNGYTLWRKERATWNETTHECSLSDSFSLAAGTYYFAVRYYLGTGNYQFSIGKGCQFSDVSESDFFFKPVMWAVENGVTGGEDPTYFAPKKTVRRSDAMVFFWAANDRPEEEAESKIPLRM